MLTDLKVNIYFDHWFRLAGGPTTPTSLFTYSPISVLCWVIVMSWKILSPAQLTSVGVSNIYIIFKIVSTPTMTCNYVFYSISMIWDGEIFLIAGVTMTTLPLAINKQKIDKQRLGSNLFIVWNTITTIPVFFCSTRSE